MVAGTPVIDSPRAWVTISLPSTVTRTITAFRWLSAMVSRTIFITASACAGSADAMVEPLLASEEEESEDEVFDVHAARSARTHVSRRTRRFGVIPELGRSGRPLGVKPVEPARIPVR
nr:hypothetical protein GCM10017611_16230 [Rhodococcus wratislaviensis]